jgi:hypothetical protein
MRTSPFGFCIPTDDLEAPAYGIDDRRAPAQIFPDAGNQRNHLAGLKTLSIRRNALEYSHHVASLLSVIRREYDKTIIIKFYKNSTLATLGIQNFYRKINFFCLRFVMSETSRAGC